MLREWVKDASNPVVPTLPGDTPGDLFRDPTTAWKVNDTWWMGVGAANTTGHGTLCGRLCSRGKGPGPRL